MAHFLGVAAIIVYVQNCRAHCVVFLTSFSKKQYAFQIRYDTTEIQSKL